MKKQLLLSGLFILFFGGIFFLTLDTKLDLNGDNAIYIQLARTMSQGHGYSVDTVDGFQPASHFPPGYPAILSLFVRLGLDSLFFFKVLNGLFLLASFFLLIYITRKETNQVYLSFSIAVLACFSPQLLHFAGIAMSEMSYLFCTSLSLWSLYRYSATSTDKRFWRSPYFYIAVVAAVGSYYIRTVGASILFAGFVFYLFRKEWWSAFSSAFLSLLLLMPWSLRNSYYGIESRYLGTIMTVNPWRPEEGSIGTFGEFFQKLLTNIDETVIKGFRELLFPFLELNYQEPSGFLGIFAGIIVVAIIFWGAWNMGKMRWAFIAFLLANIGLFALWHGGNGARYVVPIEPILYICFYVGVYKLILLAIRKPIKNDSYWPLLFLIMALPSISSVQRFAEQNKQPYHPAYSNYFAIAKLMNSKAPKGVVVSCRKPELFSYYAPNVKTTRYLYSLDSDELIQDLVNRKVDYVILEQLGYSSTHRYLLPAIQSHMDLFSVIWAPENPETYLFKFNREEASRRLDSKKNTSNISNE